MVLQEAKQAVLEATKKLVASQLVARTWGNISCRVGKEHFLITPSGKSYEHLTEDQLVLVSLEGLAYTGSLKPSSEKGIHALVYRTHPQVNCVITHPSGDGFSDESGWQWTYPSAMSGENCLERLYPPHDMELPGTKALMNQVGRILKGLCKPCSPDG